MPEADSKRSGTSQPLDSDAAPLQPTLERAESRLKSALEEACETDVERVDTGELIRVEEVLAIANEAAKEAISVRRRQRIGPSTEDQTPALRAASRSVRAADGREWRVFAVFPSSRPGRAVVRDDFAAGWLSFDSHNETRRLAPIPDAWGELSDDELIQLCERAERSSRRRKSNELPSP